MKLSYRGRLLLVFAPLTVIPLLVAFQLVYFWASAELHERESNALESRLAGEARSITHLLDRAQGDLATLAHLSTLRNFLQNRKYGLLHEAEVDRRDFEDFTRDVMKRAGYYALVLLADVGGAEISRVDGIDGSEAFAATTAHPNITSGRAGLSLLDGATPGRGWLRFYAPVELDGRPVSSLSVLIDTRTLTARLSALASRVTAPLMLSTATGGVLFSTGSPWTRPQGAGAASVAVGTDGWHLHGGLPEANLSEALWSLRKRMGGLFLIVFAFVGALVLSLADRFARPIRALAAAVEAFGNESFTTRVATSETVREVDLLAEGFNTMAAKLERLNDDNRQHIETLTSMQSQLVQAEKLSAVGQLTAGVAHELNNPLLSLETNLYVMSQLLVRDGGSTPAVERRMSSMKDGLQRSQRIIRGLLDYSRSPSIGESTQDVRVKDVVEKVVRSLENELAPFVVDLSLLSTGTVRADPDELAQVLINLLSNAAQASVRGGALGVRLRDGVLSVADGVLRKVAARRTEDPQNLDFTMARRSSAGGDLGLGEPEAAVVIEVWDQGAGIPEEHLRRVFDPFFTTKGVGRGTGLGLSISLGIVSHYRGVIDVKSNARTGTVFTIKWPRLVESVGEVPPEAARGA